MSAEQREKFLEKARLATETANQAHERKNAWDTLMRALNIMQLAYDGSEFKNVVKAWYNEIALEAAARRQPLSQIVDEKRAEATRYMDLYDNESGF